MDDFEMLGSVVEFCLNCGKEYERNPIGRPKKFCSDKCRLAWKYRHPNPQNWRATRAAVCPECGREFFASREYGTLRKYCSHACANRGRSKKKGELNENEIK